MSTKSANLYARIEPEIKEEAEKILGSLGIPASNAINMFYRQIILQRGLPFELKMPFSKELDLSLLNEDELNRELEKGYEDVKKGRIRQAKQVFDSIRENNKR